MGAIGGVDRGSSPFGRPGAAVFPLKADLLVVVPAGAVHACNPAPGEAWSYQMLHLDAPWWYRLRVKCGLAPCGEDLLVHSEAPAPYRAFDTLNTHLFAPDMALEDKEVTLINFLVGALWPGWRGAWASVATSSFANSAATPA